jgi:hypothetical protein
MYSARLLLAASAHVKPVDLVKGLEWCPRAYRVEGTAGFVELGLRRSVLGPLWMQQGMQLGLLVYPLWMCRRTRGNGERHRSPRARHRSVAHCAKKEPLPSDAPIASADCTCWLDCMDVRLREADGRARVAQAVQLRRRRAWRPMDRAGPPGGARTPRAAPRRSHAARSWLRRPAGRPAAHFGLARVAASSRTPRAPRPHSNTPSYTPS